MYRAGWAKQQIDIQAKGYAMFGYGQWQHRAQGAQTALYARAICIESLAQNPLIICCVDFGCVTHAMRSESCRLLQEILGDSFDETAFVLTATHTHSGPGGCSYDALYNMPTPGFVPLHLDAVSQAIVGAVLDAYNSRQDTDIHVGSGLFAEDIPVAWNRALQSYNRNPDVVPRPLHETHLALDRRMNLLGFYREGRLTALLSLFGVHATCLSNRLHKHDGDNKGYAAGQAETWLAQQGVEQPVAIFAQATAGDVSPHFHGKDQLARRKAIQGDAEYAYAIQNGQYQSDMALATLSLLSKSEANSVQGATDSILSYVDFSNLRVDPEFANGVQDACTSQPCHGAAFFAGTPVDGEGTPAAISKLMVKAAQAVRAWRLSPLMRKHPDAAYYQQLYGAQGPKPIVLEAGRKRILGQALDAPPGFVDPLIAEMNRQVKAGAIVDSPLVPSVLPLQIVLIGNIAVLCCPGEFTTTAGKRLVETVTPILKQRGIRQVLLCSYCNDYMGYVTTFEEYQQQAYEGGHTLFGQWTLAAFQTCFKQLAQQLLKPVVQRSHDQHTRPAPVPQDELALRTNRGDLRTAVP